MKLKSLFTSLPHLTRQASFIANNKSVELSDANVIISLTAVSYRFHSLHLVLASLLNQSVKPLAIHLWLDKESMKKLPRKVLNFEKYGVEFHEVEDLRSYKKLIFALQTFPDHSVITVDDDVIYPNHWLQHLLAENKEYPHEILSYRCKKLALRDAGNLDKYSTFPVVELSSDTLSCLSYLAIGYAGILYPKDSLSPEVQNKDYFMTHCATADDVWFKAMALLQKTPCRKINAQIGKEVNPPFTQGKRLTKTNVHQNLNDVQLQRVFEDYALCDIIS